MHIHISSHRNEHENHNAILVGTHQTKEELSLTVINFQAGWSKENTWTLINGSVNWYNHCETVTLVKLKIHIHYDSNYVQNLLYMCIFVIAKNNKQSKHINNRKDKLLCGHTVKYKAPMKIDNHYGHL